MYSSVNKLVEGVDQYIAYYNEKHPHSSINNMKMPKKRDNMMMLRRYPITIRNLTRLLYLHVFLDVF
ncbi:hypothetical protein [Erysipelothrix sp. HDW6A]|uniref:hypothetical protein n=1 Tax=Erysipelothrix sp. HDW6A TaxID=2714928 RepID=UPI00351B3A85